MLHHDIDPRGDKGHWAVARSSNGTDVLVQIGEVMETRQARLKLTVRMARHLAGDLRVLATGADPRKGGTGVETPAWSIAARRNGQVTLTLRDADRSAHAEATLAMPREAMLEMAAKIEDVASTLPAGDAA